MPIPLGGTSNHFLFDELRELGGWDSYNVTEDADLGLHIARAGKRIKLLRGEGGITWEVANGDWWAWVKQRSRWIKGYLQTFCVHFGILLGLGRKWGGIGRWFSALVTLLNGFAVPLLMPLFWLMTALYSVSLLLVVLGDARFGRVLAALQAMNVDWAVPWGTGVFFIGNAVYLVTFLLGYFKHDRPGRLRWLIAYWWLYWLLMGIAALRAVVDFVFTPHSWEKSDHAYAAAPGTI
jgi:hypothetical protein